MNESGEVVSVNSFIQETGGYHYSTEEMLQHPHPPMTYLTHHSSSASTSANYSAGSPYHHRRALSNPSDRMNETESSYFSSLVTHGISSGGRQKTNPFLSDQQQHHVYHNPLVYGNNVFEEFSPSDDAFDGRDDILSDTLGNIRLGSGSGESGYHGAFQDTNPNSPLSSSASTNPRTPLKQIPSMYSHQRTPSNLSNTSSGSFGMNYDGDISMATTPLRYYRLA